MIDWEFLIAIIPQLMLTEERIAIIPLWILTENSSITVQMVRIPGFHPRDLDSSPIYGWPVARLAQLGLGGSLSWSLEWFFGFWLRLAPCGRLQGFGRIGGILIYTCWDHSAQLGEQPGCSNFLFIIDSNYLHYWSPTSHLQCWGIGHQTFPKWLRQPPCTFFYFLSHLIVLLDNLRLCRIHIPHLNAEWPWLQN